MNTNKPKFEHTWMLYALALIVVVLFVLLGNWQLDRAEQKRELMKEFEAGLSGEVVSLSEAGRFQRVQLTGYYESERQLLLDNMVEKGRAGFHVLTVFKLVSGVNVVVNRGWLPFTSGRDDLPDISVDENARTISGYTDTLPQVGLKMGGDIAVNADDSFPQLVHFPSMEELSVIAGRELFPFVIKLDADQADGYGRDWQVVTFGPDRHLAYALQWFSLALVVVVVTIVMHRRKRKKRNE